MKKIEMASRKVLYEPPVTEVQRFVIEGVIATSIVTVQVNEIDWLDGGEVTDTEGSVFY